MNAGPAFNGAEVNAGATVKPGTIIAAGTKSGLALESVPTVGAAVWPIRWQQSSGLLNPAHWLFVFAQQAIAVSADRRSANAVAATELATNNTTEPINTRARVRTHSLCSLLEVETSRSNLRARGACMLHVRCA